VTREDRRPSNTRLSSDTAIVRAGALPTAPGAAVAILGRDREAAATDAALEQSREQETGAMQFIERRREVWIGQGSRDFRLHWAWTTCFSAATSAFAFDTND
jgi:hypothetical protein